MLPSDLRSPCSFIFCLSASDFLHRLQRCFGFTQAKTSRVFCIRDFWADFGPRARASQCCDSRQGSRYAYLCSRLSRSRTWGSAHRPPIYFLQDRSPSPPAMDCGSRPLLALPWGGALKHRASSTRASRGEFALSARDCPFGSAAAGSRRPRRKGGNPRCATHSPLPTIQQSCAEPATVFAQGLLVCAPHNIAIYAPPSQHRQRKQTDRQIDRHICLHGGGLT